MTAPENRWIAFFALGLLTVCVLYLLAGPRGVAWDLRPGSPVGQSLGISAAVLLLASLCYLPVRRSDNPRWRKPYAQLLHSLIATTGVTLAIAHSRASLSEWSTLVLLAVVALLATGLWGRVIAPQRLGAAFGRGASPYLPVSELNTQTGSLAQHVETKRRVLRTLAVEANEAEFVLRLHHWTRHPCLALRYHRLATTERRLLVNLPSQCQLSDRPHRARLAPSAPAVRGPIRCRLDRARYHHGFLCRLRRSRAEYLLVALDAMVTAKKRRVGSNSDQ